MNTAVALVKAYLRFNGYFCATEYPLMDTAKDGNVRTVSNQDILALRHFSNGTLDLLAILERIDNTGDNRREKGETDR